MSVTNRRAAVTLKPEHILKIDYHIKMKLLGQGIQKVDPVLENTKLSGRIESFLVFTMETFLWSYIAF